MSHVSGGDNTRLSKSTRRVTTANRASVVQPLDGGGRDSKGIAYKVTYAGCVEGDVLRTAAWATEEPGDGGRGLREEGEGSSGETGHHLVVTRGRG